MTDAEALALVRRGRCEGLEWLMERYTRYVGAVGSRILAGRLGQEDAEEVVSDAFLALWRAARSLRTESVRAWLGTTARNLALNRLRAAHFDAELSEDTLRLDADPAQALEETLLRQTVTAAVDALPEPDRTIFLAHYWRCRSTAEIAAETGLSPEAVRQRLSRGREKLRRALEEVMNDGD